MKSLSTVARFGAVDADSDDLLLQSFEDHPAFMHLLNRDKFLVIGRKGAGKTAIFKRLLTTYSSKFFTFGHTFSDYPWHHHSLQARIGIPDFDKYTHSWKYLLLLTLSKIILNQDGGLPFDEASFEASTKVEQFVVDTYGSRDPDVSQIFTPTRRINLKPNFEINFGLLKAGVTPEAVPMGELPKVVGEVNNNLLRWVLACLHPEHEYFVAFDQLDLGFDPEDPDYRHRLTGLLLAARDLNLAAREAGKEALVAVFLRDDIYDGLHFEDKNKITENFVSILEWDAGAASATLRELMEKRFTAVLGERTEKIAWESVFDESQEMPGHQSKYQHLLDRTFLRPRDMIKFVNIILKRYQSRVANGETAELFENADLHASRGEYSSYLRAELDDEVHKHLPDFDDWLDLITAMGGWQFEPSVFESGAVGRGLANSESEALTALERLYKFSIVGFYRPGGGGYGGSEYVFRYRDPRTRFDRTASIIRVHPGLIESLGLKRVTLRTNGIDSSESEGGH